jgi:hypothetical protein
MAMFAVYQYFMTVNNGRPKKRGRGRPPRPGGRDPIYSFRPPKEMAAAIDARAKSEGISRTEALVGIVAEGLAAIKRKKGKG